MRLQKHIGKTHIDEVGMLACPMSCTKHGKIDFGHQTDPDVESMTMYAGFATQLEVS